VVVAFRAEWCLASQEMVPMVDDLAARYEGQAKVLAIDVDGDPRDNKICQQFKVTRLPVTMVFREGRVTDFIGGVASAGNLTEMIDRQVRPVIDVDEFSFDAEVLRAQVPVLVFVDAAWCAVSRDLAPAVETVAAELRGRAKVTRLEYGTVNARLCAQYGFIRVPTLALFSQGQLEDQIFGALATTGAERTAHAGRSAADTITQMIDRFIL
jgi:thioredoxin 1